MREFSQAFQQQLWDLVLSSATMIAEGFEKHCQSPIEVDFCAAFFLAVDNSANEAVFISLPDGPASSSGPPCYYIRPQMQIGRHRVDFVVGVSWGDKEAIVECDGRDFHHATRFQIERDRMRDMELEAVDYKVFRFPGTEIHNDPFGCALAVINWLCSENGSPRASAADEK